MTLTKSFIPYGTYWSSPFCRWQGALATEHSIKLAARSAEKFLAGREIPVSLLDSVVLGTTVPQQHAFYGAPWLGAMLGAPEITGPTVSQACATSVRMLASAAADVELDQASCVLGVACDRTSNGPHILYPNPSGIGGRGDTEEWVWDNFNKDPYAKMAMVQTAENVASRIEASREEQDAIALLRSEQYEKALADDRAFQKRYMLPLTIGRGKRAKEVALDEGIHPTTAEGLAKLGPALENGTVTFGSQTHPADGNAGLLVCSEERADELSRDSKVKIQILSFGSARVEKGCMPMAVAPAIKVALEGASVKLGDLKAIKTHNPFAINDVCFSREMGIEPEKFNNYGCSLVYGHPQAPTGLRGIIELIEELEIAGGGIGVFGGCAAGDSAMATVVRVG